MPVVAFLNKEGILTHIVKTDGANAERDLLVHTEAAKETHAQVRFEDEEYSEFNADDKRLVEYIAARAGGKPVLVAAVKEETPSPPEPSEKQDARSAAFNAAIASDKSYGEAMQAGENAARASVAVAPDAVST